MDREWDIMNIKREIYTRQSSSTRERTTPFDLGVLT